MRFFTQFVLPFLIGFGLIKLYKSEFKKKPEPTKEVKVEARD